MPRPGLVIANVICLQMSETENHLNEMIQLFDDDGWDSWANFFREALALYQNGELSKCGQHILNGSAGMGSLNDVILGQDNYDGELRWKPNYKESNQRYNELLAKLYGFAEQSRRAKETR